MTELQTELMPSRAKLKYLLLNMKLKSAFCASFKIDVHISITLGCGMRKGFSVETGLVFLSGALTSSFSLQVSIFPVHTERDYFKEK